MLELQTQILERFDANPMDYFCSGIIDGNVVTTAQSFELGKNVILRSDRPGWRNRIRQGLQAGNPYIVEVYSLKATEGRLKSSRYAAGPACKNWASFDYQGDLLVNVANAGPPSIPTTDGGLNVMNITKNKFIQKALSQQRAFTGSTFIGEGLDALRMVVRPARALRDATDRYSEVARMRARRAVRRRSLTADEYSKLSRKQKRAVSDAITGSWLEFQFGARPLMSDVKTGAEAVAAWVNRFRWQKQYISAFTEAETFSATDSYVITLGYAYLRVFRDRITRHRCRYVGEIGLENLPERSWGQHFGLMPRDWIPTVWELVPYSFLVDYFTNIGDLIEWAAYPKVSFRWYVRSLLAANSRRNSATVARATNATATPVEGSTRIDSFAPSLRHWEYIRFERHVDQGSLVPSFQFKIPGVGSTKWLNIAALAGARTLFR